MALLSYTETNVFVFTNNSIRENIKTNNLY